MEFTGEFETHITVSLNNLDEVNRLQQWSGHHGLKFLHIVLDRGVTASQPMLKRHGWGHFTNELAIATTLCQSLKCEGFSAVRIKMEIAPWNDSVPKSTPEARNHPPDQYFEHHIKLLLEPFTEIASLMELAEQHSAHLSHNVLQAREDNCHERFVTQRCVAIGHQEAQQQLQRLLDAIAILDFTVIAVEEEFVVYDSNLDLDKGWIQQ